MSLLHQVLLKFPYIIFPYFLYHLGKEDRNNSFHLMRQVWQVLNEHYQWHN